HWRTRLSLAANRCRSHPCTSRDGSFCSPSQRHKRAINEPSRRRTIRRMLLKKLTSLARLTDALSRATSAEEVYAASLDCLQESLGVERASILLFDADDVMSFVAWRGISDAIVAQSTVTRRGGRRRRTRSRCSYRM